MLAAIDVAGIHTIVEYIRMRQATINEKVACRPIYELCVEADWMPGASRILRWWDQDVVNEPEE